MNQSYIERKIELSGAEIKALELVGTHIRGLTAERLRVADAVDLAGGFTSSEAVHLVAAEIGGYLSFDHATLNRADKEASGGLVADGIRVRQSVFFRDHFVAHDTVRLIRGRIEGNLDCRGGVFLGANGVALNADGISVEGDIRLDRDDREGRDFVAAGKLSLPGARVDGDVNLGAARFDQPSYIDLRGAIIKRSLLWRVCSKAFQSKLVTLDLQDSNLAFIADNPDCWPNTLELAGLRYQRFTGGPTDAPRRLEWLRKQPKRFTDSYQQLARALKEGGDSGGARLVLIEMQFDQRAASPNFFSHLWSWILCLAVGYGYAPWRALYFTLIFVAIGAILFHKAFRVGIMTPTDEDAFRFFKCHHRSPVFYAEFFAPMYALDTFLPIINFGQKDSWGPNPHRGKPWINGLTAGWLVRSYLWFHIASGWLLTTLFVAGITGLIQSP